MANEPLPPTPPSLRERAEDEIEPSKGTPTRVGTPTRAGTPTRGSTIISGDTPTKDAIEIRGDDIRAATSKQRKDRSPNLPRPTMVSDKPGRPIVSFKQDWKPKEVVLEEVQSAGVSEPIQESRAKGSMRTAAPPIPKINVPDVQVHEVTTPPIPTIVFPDDPTVPSIVLPEEPDFATTSSQFSAPNTPLANLPMPTFSFSGPDNDSTPAPSPAKRPTPGQPSFSFSGPIEPPTPAPRRPLPIPTRPAPHHAATTGALPTTRGMARAHSTIYARPSGVLCAHCALPIAGRILSAAGERFHPGCFVCHACGTNLECVAFYPEPEKQTRGASHVPRRPRWGR